MNWRSLLQNLNYAHLSGQGGFERNRLWVLKNAVIGTCFLAGSVAADKFSFLTSAKGDWHRRGYRLAEEPHQSLDVLRGRRQEELLTHELQSPQAQAAQSDLMLQFREQGFHLLPLPLCFGELWRVDQLPRTLSGWFVLVDAKAPEGSTGALWSERARATLFACPDVVVSAVPMNPTAVVQGLTGGADIAIVCRLVRERRGAENRTPLSVDTVAFPNVRSDVAVPQPLQKLPVAIGRVGRHRIGRPPLPSGEAIEHVLCGYGFLTHSGRCGLHAHDHAAVVVHQIVVVIPQTGWRTALGGIGRIGIGGRDLVLLMHRFFHRVLLFQFFHILTHRMVDSGSFRQLLAWNAALLGRVGFDKTAIDRQLFPSHQPHFHALFHDLFEQLLEQLRFLKPSVPILGKRRVVRDLLIKTQSREPSPRQMHAQLLDQLALAADAVQVADQQNAQQQLRIDRGPPRLAVAVFQLLPHELETDVLVDQP